MLSAPDSFPSALNDLRFEHATQSRRQCIGGFTAERRLNKGVTRFITGDRRQQFKYVNHGIIVVRDIVVVTALQRINLWPATVCKLSSKNEIHSFDEPRFTILPLRRMPYISEEAHFISGSSFIGGRASLR